MGDEGPQGHDALARHVQNKSFPIVPDTWDAMWRHAKDLYPELDDEEFSSCRKSPPPRTVVKPPTLSANQKVEDQIYAIQRYVESLQYNHIGEHMFPVDH